MNEYLKYAQDTVSSDKAGNLIKLACQRFLNDLQRTDLEFREDEVNRCISFIGLFKHYTGSHSGEQFQLQAWQQFIVANIIGFYWKGTNRRRFTNSYIEVSRKQGKALSLSTLIPTPAGWTTMNDIKEGDIILGADGKPTKVTYVTPVMYNHDCYKVTFEDGEQVIADKDHNWYVKQHDKQPRIMTTGELLNFSHKRSDGKGTEYHYRVPINKPIELPKVDLPIEPYALGCQLRDKHIPDIYLRSSKEQRLALLQGLMDTDGYVSSSGECEFVQNADIADKFCELLSTLGIKYNRTIKILNGKQCSQVHRIRFFTDKTLPCFRLERKYNRLKDKLNNRMCWKSIVNIEKVESEPVKCITVDNKDHLYLFGSRFTVTHNTALAAALCLYFLIGDKENGAEVLLAANSKDQAKIAFEMCSVFAKQLDKTGKKLICYRADILFNATNSKLKCLAADDSKLDGFNASFGLIDK